MSVALTTSSRVTCSSNGTVQTSSGAKLTVNGAPVLLASGIAGKPIAGCTHPTSSSPTATPCTTVASLSGGMSTKLTAGGAPVVLDSVGGLGDAVNPPDTISAQAQQTKLTAS